MGREAVCRCAIDGVAAEAKVLLEATALIVRAPFRRTFPVAALRDVAVAGDDLCLTVGDTAIILALGAATAAGWAKRIATPAPRLAAKLGIGHAAPAFVVGEVIAPELIDALDGHTAGAHAATQSVAVVADANALAAAVAAHEAALGRAPLWLVHGKGRGAAFGEAPVGAAMRARGDRDVKVAAVDADLTATRYVPG